MEFENMEMRERAPPKQKRKDDPASIERRIKERDVVTLALLGKKQQLNRNFGFLSVIAFSSTIIATWECVTSTFNAGLVNGGPVSLVYGFLVCFLGTLATSASMAEMASIAPVSGGQYHWVFLFAPRKYAAVLSWIAGWVLVCGWVVGCASGMFLAATQIQGLWVLNYPDYVFQRWHGTMLFWAIMLLAASVNIFGIRILPHIESLALILHIGYWFVLIVPLVYLAPQSSNEFVFATSINAGGWSSYGVSWCIGLLTTVYSLAGFDGACHMSEEVHDASKVVPKSMVATIWINGVLAFGMILALLYSIGDVNQVLNTPTGYPFIQIFFNATQSTRATNAMTALLSSGLIFASFGQLATASRVTWAFSRDNGLPYSTFFAHVDPNHAIPVRSIILVTCLNTLWGLVNIGSSTAFNAITSVAVVSLFGTYAMAIFLLILRRTKPEPISFGPWSLGKSGMAINIFAVVFVLFICIFSLFPAYQPVTASNMNYASAVFGVVVIITFVAWHVYGKKKFKGPIREVLAERSLAQLEDSRNGRPVSVAVM